MWSLVPRYILPNNDWILYSLPSSPVGIVLIIYTRSEGLPLSTRLYPPCQGRALATLDKEWWPWPCVAWHLWLVIKWMDGKDWSSHVVWKYQLLNVHQYLSMFNQAWFVGSMCGKEHVKLYMPRGEESRLFETCQLAFREDPIDPLISSWNKPQQHMGLGLNL